MTRKRKTEIRGNAQGGPSSERKKRSVRKLVSSHLKAKSAIGEYIATGEHLQTAAYVLEVALAIEKSAIVDSASVQLLRAVSLEVTRHRDGRAASDEIWRSKRLAKEVEELYRRIVKGSAAPEDVVKVAKEVLGDQAANFTDADFNVLPLTAREVSALGGPFDASSEHVSIFLGRKSKRSVDELKRKPVRQSGLAFGRPPASSTKEGRERFLREALMKIFGFSEDDLIGIFADRVKRARLRFLAEIEEGKFPPLLEEYLNKK